jgi:hexulose-6-phosphate isomerase
MEKAIDFAGELGIRVIQLAGYDVYYEESTEDSVKRFKEGMQWAAEKAANAQVMLAMEIMDTRFMNSISKHLPYEENINSPWYRVYPDLGNLSAWPENDPEAELNKGIGSIVAIHLKDTLAVTDSFEGKFKCVPFGEGCVDFPARFAQLEKLNYNGPYMIEMWHQNGNDDVSEIAKAAKWLNEQYEKGMKLC